MPTPTYVAVTEGTGKKLAADTYTENGQTVLDQKVVQGLPYLATYRINEGGSSVVLTTGGSHLLEIMGGASLIVYVRHIWVYQVTMAGATALSRFSITRLTTAGTGGTSYTPAALDTTDGAAGATAMTLPSSPGNIGGSISYHPVILLSTLPTVGGIPMLVAEWDFGDDTSKMIRIGPGGSAGIAVRNIDAVATATVMINAEIIESDH